MAAPDQMPLLREGKHKRPERERATLFSKRSLKPERGTTDPFREIPLPLSHLLALGFWELKSTSHKGAAVPHLCSIEFTPFSLSAGEADLRSFLRIFLGELQRGFFERHVWLSLWDRPPRSRFTRVQRASCCCLLIFLFLCANAVWYGVVADANFSQVPISTLIPVNGETVLVGLVSSLVVYPLYLVLLFLFRMARSKVNVSQSLAHSDQQSLEIDNYLDSSLLESSFITFPGLRTE
ncbi:hypothetical protein Chor_015060, partial [Crotalus horridus]